MGIQLEEFVNVAVRIRSSLNVLEESVSVKVVSEQPPVLYVANRQSYTFDHIFTPKASQEDVYNVLVKPLVQKVLLGYNSTVFAYGQTGTGKTYTMGSDPKVYKDPGFIPRAFDELFAHQQQCKELEVYVSFYEIYNEKVFDLLSNSKTSLLVKGLKIEGLTQMQVHTSDEAQKLLNVGSVNRHVGETKLNEYSSRSHAIFTIHCHTKRENVETEAKLNLVDLAGSESVRRTGNEGSKFQEGVNINMGLFNIRRVISALSANKAHVPYRESMITTILQDSLSRRNFVTLLACVSPDSQDVNETMQSLEFAQGAKKMKNKPEVNCVIQDYKKQNPSLFERPTLTNSAVKPKTTPLKRQNHSMEYFATPSLAKKPKVINHTWTPMSTIAEPQVQDPVALQTLQFSTISPIARKCVEVFENTMMNKIEELLITHSSRIADKRRTSRFLLQDLQAGVSQMVRNELLQMSQACSSPIEPLPEEPGIAPIAKRLNFDDDMVFKKPTLLVKKSPQGKSNFRRSKRLSKIPETDDGPKRRQSVRLQEMKKSPPVPSPRAVPSKQTPVPAPRRTKKTDPKKEHCAYILGILNKGERKDLEKLPAVGPKTAAQIYFYRNLNGPFKSIQDLREMETWRGRGYQRFLTANFLSDLI